MEDVRNMLLMELIDKMHGRLADKMYPAEQVMDDSPEVAEVSPTAAEAENEVDVDNDAETMSDEDLNTLMKQGE